MATFLGLTVLAGSRNLKVFGTRYMFRVFTRCLLFAHVEQKNELIKETCAAFKR